MAAGEKNIEGKKEALILLSILIGVVIVGVFGLFALQRLSINNKHICKYLGGLWERKAEDPAHRCYTYQQYYGQER